jgi:hypothetical protein
MSMGSSVTVLADSAACFITSGMAMVEMHMTLCCSTDSLFSVRVPVQGKVEGHACYLFILHGRLSDALPEE